MAQIKIKKGHSLRIAGTPKNDVISIVCDKVGLCPSEYRYVKPKLLVKEGDHVEFGTPLFFNKENPEQIWGSPGAGKVLKIQLGPRRIIEKIIIKLDNDEKTYSGKKYSKSEIVKLGRDDIKNILSTSNIWHILRQRPFNCVVNPQDSPRDIFISVYNTAPLAPNLELILNGQKEILQAGINILSKLTDGKVNVGIPNNNNIDELNGLENCAVHQISGPHPAGNVGIQIHHIAPLKPDDKIWTIGLQHLLILGKLFLNGTIDPTIIVSVAGPGTKGPIHVKTRLGACVNKITEENLKDDENRIISGDVLTGRQTDENDCIGFYDTIISVLPVDKSRPFLGWLHLGSSKKRYSLTRSFLSFGNKNFIFSTKQNGNRRALVPIDAWEDVLPMDILPNPLYRSILACDIEEMEQLGIWECDDEDFALCSFACHSKIDLGGVIRQGLDLMWKEF